MEEVGTKYWTLAAAAAVPLSPPELVQSWGETLVVAPHPDDESLGCGGAIALLREAGLRAHLALFTDGRHSHPHSREYPAERLIELRRQEFTNAAATLGVPVDDLHFLNLPDAHVPAPDSAEGVAAIATLRALLQRVQTVLVTWRGDPHCDHTAAQDFVTRAAAGLPVRLLEYPVWVWQNGAPEEAPAREGFNVWRLDVSSVSARKQAAIQAHRSQLGEIITDDPSGFTIPAELLQHFQAPWELFLSAR